MFLHRTCQAREVLTPCLIFFLHCQTRSRHVKSLPNELVHESDIVERRRIMNIFELEEDETRPANGTMKDGTNDQDQHINPYANTPVADSIVSCMLTRVIISTNDVMYLSLTAPLS